MLFAEKWDLRKTMISFNGAKYEICECDPRITKKFTDEIICAERNFLRFAKKGTNLQSSTYLIFCWKPLLYYVLETFNTANRLNEQNSNDSNEMR